MRCTKLPRIAKAARASFGWTSARPLADAESQFNRFLAQISNVACEAAVSVFAQEFLGGKIIEYEKGNTLKKSNFYECRLVAQPVWPNG